MNVFQKILKADAGRKSRFHTSRGDFCGSFPDFCVSAFTTADRHWRGRLANLPWLTFPAIRHIREQLEGRRLFEYGSGKSTAWYAARCTEVFSVETDASWYAKILGELQGQPNAHLILAKNAGEAVDAIGAIGGQFDAIVIDSQISQPTDLDRQSIDDQHRVACLRRALQFASSDCLFIIDNTDVNINLTKEISAQFREQDILKFPGWAPGLLHPIETTVAYRRL